MKKRLSALLLLFAMLLCLCSCSKDSTFSIHFIDVGQGDAALVECDGHYMLIDGGNKSAGDRVYDVLKENDIQHLDILAISHLHEDHFGGLIKALTYASSIDQTICVSEASDLRSFGELQHQLSINGSHITVPSAGDKYGLGSAVVEVVDVGGDEVNDSLVMLITYGKTTFLFTGDIEGTAQTRISDKYQNDADDPFKVDLVEIPHHGAYSNELYRFLRTFMPDYTVISVGANNNHHHPRQETLDLLNSKTWKPAVFRTDKDGDIIVKSNGRKISVETSK